MHHLSQNGTDQFIMGSFTDTPRGDFKVLISTLIVDLD